SYTVRRIVNGVLVEMGGADLYLARSRDNGGGALSWALTRSRGGHVEEERGFTGQTRPFWTPVIDPQVVELGGLCQACQGRDRDVGDDEPFADRRHGQAFPMM